MHYPGVNVGHAISVLHCNLTPLKENKGNSCRGVGFVLKECLDRMRSRGAILCSLFE